MTTIIAIAAAVMSALSLVLHAVAPHTKSTLDDRAAEVIDKVIEALPKK